MKLICLLIFCILSFSEQKTVTNSGRLLKNTPKTFDYNGYCIYVDLDDFSGSSIKVKVTIKSGNFEEKIMYWGGYYSLPTDGYDYILSAYESYSYEENDYRTLYFYITPSSLFSYAFFAIPDFNGGPVEIEWSSSGLSAGAIAGIVIAVIVVVTIIIVIFIRRRRMVSAQPVIAPPVQQTYIPPVQPVYSQNVAPNYPLNTQPAVQPQNYY